ncbi:hypothetical protein F5Y17DRAFT_352225 [Xylariaceae sp. FL0594]|nr:hypothetical protein F5Y17DRAFT_352225 [Xylariaceae sp. FL0594]
MTQFNSTAVLYRPATNETDAADFNLNIRAAHGNALEAWDGRPKSLGLTFDSDATRRIFYIGSDSMLHCQSAPNFDMDYDSAKSWSVCTDIDASLWPAADSPDAVFASTFDASRNAIWIFYMSGGNLTQVHRSSKDKWERPIPLPTSPPSPTPPGQEGGYTGRVIPSYECEDRCRCRSRCGRASAPASRVCLIYPEKG